MKITAPIVFTIVLALLPGTVLTAQVAGEQDVPLKTGRRLGSWLAFAASRRRQAAPGRTPPHPTKLPVTIQWSFVGHILFTGDLRRQNCPRQKSSTIVKQ